MTTAPFVSYSTNREDVYLHRLFATQPSGFYVDVGAAHPTYENDTKALYDRGWSGINIEPNGDFFEGLATGRPRDRNLPLAVSDTPGELTFYHVAGTGLSTADPDEAERARGRGLCVSEMRVAADTLANILAASAPGVIDLLKVDVEGHELPVLRSNDWARFRPRVVLVEATFPERPQRRPDQVTPFLEGQGYRRVFFDGLNDWYVEQAFAVPPEAFDRPANIFDGAVPLAQVELAAARDFLTGQVASLTQERVNGRAYSLSLRQALDVECAALAVSARELAAVRHVAEARAVDLDRLGAELVALRARLSRAVKGRSQAPPHAAAQEDAALAQVAAQRDLALADTARLCSALDYANAELGAARRRPDPASAPADAVPRAALDQARAEAATVQAGLEAEVLRHRDEVLRHQDEVRRLQAAIHALGHSTSWRVTRPLRALAHPGRSLRALLGRAAG